MTNRQNFQIIVFVIVALLVGCALFSFLVSNTDKTSTLGRLQIADSPERTNERDSCTMGGRIPEEEPTNHEGEKSDLATDTQNAVPVESDLLDSLDLMGTDHQRDAAQQLDRQMISIFGFIPENPIAELGKLDEEKLETLLREYPQFGFLLGRVHGVDRVLRMRKRISY